MAACPLERLVSLLIESLSGTLVDAEDLDSRTHCLQREEILDLQTTTHSGTFSIGHIWPPKITSVGITANSVERRQSDVTSEKHG